MEGEYHTVSEASLSQLRFERIVQEGSGPFERAHCLAQPSLVYQRMGTSDPALGCLGAPTSHRSFMPFGTASLVPAHMSLHVRSPAFSAREMYILRFDEMRFDDLTGVGMTSSPAELSSCFDINAQDVLEAMERLAREFANPGFAHETIVTGLGQQILGELARHFEGLRQQDGRRNGMLAPWQVARIEERLKVADQLPPDIDELASICGIGRRHLMRAYKITTGSTVMKRVDQTVFQRAMTLLANESLSVKFVAGTLGFDCQSSFSTAFRRRFGQTPSEWRAMQRAMRVVN